MNGRRNFASFKIKGLTAWQDQEKPELDSGFAVRFRDGEAMAREWIDGRGELPGLLHIVRDMPKGGDMGGLEAGFLSHIDAAVRGDRRGEAGPPDPAKAQLMLEGLPSPEAPIDMDAFVLRRRQLAKRALLEKFGRLNDEAWREQHAFVERWRGDSRRKDADWRGL
jgi:hypothetical protein